MSTFEPYTIGTAIDLNQGEWVEFENYNYTFSKGYNQNFYFDTYNGINYQPNLEVSGNIMSLMNYADELQYYCFYGLFKERAKSITTAPYMPAKTLVEGAYRQMFYNCPNLKSIDIGIEDTSNVPYGMYYMLYTCTSLTEIKVHFTKWSTATDCFNGWVQGVASSGTFIKPAELPEEYNSKRIPSGWTVENV
jgi:surface protein